MIQQRTSSLKSKRKNRVIHVTVGLKRNGYSANSSRHSSSTNTTKVVSHTANLSQFTSYSNEKWLTDNYHRKIKRNSKKKFSRQCMIGTISASVVAVLLMITSILLVLFIKPKSTARVTPILRWNKTGITLAGTAGSPGNDVNKLNQPFDVKVDHANNMYVVERENHQVRKFPFGSSIGTVIAGNGTLGSSIYLTLLQRPQRIYLDSNETLYIVDTINGRILLWPDGASNGTRVASGYGGASLYNPLDMAINPITKDMYVLDTYNNRTISYPPHYRNSTFLFGNNGFGHNNTQLNLPCGFHFDLISNSFIIANTLSHNIVRHAIGEKTWALVVGSMNGTSGSSSNSLAHPREVMLDPMGNMYVVDQDNRRIQFFYPGQSDGITIAGITSVASTNSNTLNFPTSMTLDNQLNLYVADTYNHRIQKFFRY